MPTETMELAGLPEHLENLGLLEQLAPLVRRAPPGLPAAMATMERLARLGLQALLGRLAWTAFQVRRDLLGATGRTETPDPWVWPGRLVRLAPQVPRATLETTGRLGLQGLQAQTAKLASAVPQEPRDHRDHPGTLSMVKMERLDLLGRPAPRVCLVVEAVGPLG